jgi:hypothetical protein
MDDFVIRQKDSAYLREEARPIVRRANRGTRGLAYRSDRPLHRQGQPDFGAGYPALPHRKASIVAHERNSHHPFKAFADFAQALMVQSHVTS